MHPAHIVEELELTTIRVGDGLIVNDTVCGLLVHVPAVPVTVNTTLVAKEVVLVPVTLGVAEVLPLLILAPFGTVHT